VVRLLVVRDRFIGAALLAVIRTSIDFWLEQLEARYVAWRFCRGRLAQRQQTGWRKR
jgi:hypothetical protein